MQHTRKMNMTPDNYCSQQGAMIIMYVHTQCANLHENLQLNIRLSENAAIITCFI